MKLLAEISEGTLGLSNQFELLGSEYQLRKSARAILVNEDGNIATQYLHTYAYHKLPGGGVDAGESIEEALKREVKEEVGCDCQVGDVVGMTIEYRNKYKLLHLSYCHVAYVNGDVGECALEEGEIEEGQETLWLPPTELLEKMRTDTPGEYEGHFILQREISFLEEYLKSWLATYNEAAAKGSLCSRIFLAAEGIAWDKQFVGTFVEQEQKNTRLGCFFVP